MYVRLVFWDWSFFKSLFESKAKCSGGSRQGARALIFRPNWGPKGQKNFFKTAPPPSPLIWRSGSAPEVWRCWCDYYSHASKVFTRKVSHLSSFRKWEFFGLLWHWRRPVFTPALSPDTLDHFSGQNWVNLSWNVFAYSLDPLLSFGTHFQCRRFSFHVLSVSSAKASGNCHVLAFRSCFHHPSTLVSTVTPERGCVCCPYFLWGGGGGGGGGIVCREPSLGTVMSCFDRSCVPAY